MFADLSVGPFVLAAAATSCLSRPQQRFCRIRGTSMRRMPKASIGALPVLRINPEVQVENPQGFAIHPQRCGGFGDPNTVP